MSLFGEKKLGFGLMRLPLTDPEDAGSIDMEQLCAMVDRFMEKGYTYFDTAWMYCKHQSESAVKTALVDRYPRDSFTLTTKFHVGYAKELADRERIFRTQLEKTGAGFFDYYMVHSITRDNFPEYLRLEVFPWVSGLKAKGLARHIGFSFHGDPALLDEVLTRFPEMEFVQLQMNYLDWENEHVQSRACYEIARKHGKPIVVMEPVKGGTLANIPSAGMQIYKGVHPDWTAPAWALRFVAGLPGVEMVLSGMSDLAQLEENTDLFRQITPLTQEEQTAVARVTEILKGGKAIPCTGCAYCTGGCPMGIPIPQLFGVYNADQGVDRKKDENAAAFARLGETGGKPGDCIACGQCEGVCPQHLPIIEDLKAVAAHFEEG